MWERLKMSRSTIVTKIRSFGRNSCCYSSKNLSLNNSLKRNCNKITFKPRILIKVTKYFFPSNAPLCLIIIFPYIKHFIFALYLYCKSEKLTICFFKTFVRLSLLICKCNVFRRITVPSANEKCSIPNACLFPWD